MIEVKLSKLSGHDKSAKVGKLLVKENQAVKVGDVLFNVESTKGNFQVKSDYEGALIKILIGEGDTVKIGDTIAHIEGEKVAAGQAASATGNSKKQSYSFGIAKLVEETIECDITVIGGGPGGYVAAIKAAQLGAKVTLIEKDRLGGTCLNYGCIPTKSFVKSAHMYHDVLNSEAFGILLDNPRVDMSKIVERKEGIVDTLVGGIEHLMGVWNIRHIKGEAKVEPDHITVKNKNIDATIKSGNIILAVGSSAVKLNIEGSDSERVLTNKEILELKEIPKALTIIGGGIIGMEFAFIFNALGSDVTVIEFLDDILAIMDEDIIEVIKSACDEKGIKLYTSAKAERIMETDQNQLITAFSMEEEHKYVVGDYVLMAVGRKPNLESVDLEKLGVDLTDNKRGIAVDQTMKTSNESVYAIGDVTNIIQLAHVASHQGIVAVENIMGTHSKMHYNAVPSAVFVMPEIGTVGLSERDAQTQGLSVKVGKFPFAANGKALTAGETEGFVKVIVDEAQGTILGAAVVGPNATDMIANFTFLIENETTFEKLNHTIFAHPTTAEAIHEAILSLKEGAIHFA